MDENGILSFASDIPPYFIDADTIIRTRGGGQEDVEKIHEQGIDLIALPGPGQDSATGTYDAMRYVLNRLPEQVVDRIKNDDSRNVFFVGAESPPFQEGPTIPGIVADFLGIPLQEDSNVHGSCAAGLESLSLALALISSKNGFDFGFVGGSDVSIYREIKGKVGGALLTAGTGSAGYCVGTGNPIAVLKEIAGCSSYTPDWLIPQGKKYPEFSARTTIEAYQSHLIKAVERLKEHSLHDMDAIVFHVPVEFLPFETAKLLGLSSREIEEKIRPYMIGRKFGNAYNASALIHFNNALERLDKGSLIAVLGYGSGARAFVTIWETGHLDGNLEKAPSVEELLSSKNRMRVDIEYYYYWRRSYDEMGYLGRYGLDLKDGLVVLDDVRVVGKIEPLGDERYIYYVCENEKCGAIYSPRSTPVLVDRCVDDTCRSKLIKMEVPRYGRIKSLRELSEGESITKAILDGEYLILWPRNQLERGMIVEQKLRILGKSCIGRDRNYALRIYGPAFEFARVSAYA